MSSRKSSIIDFSYFRHTALSHNSGIALPAENKKKPETMYFFYLSTPPNRFIFGTPRRRTFHAPTLSAENKRKPNILPLKNKYQPKIKKISSPANGKKIKSVLIQPTAPAADFILQNSIKKNCPKGAVFLNGRRLRIRTADPLGVNEVL